MKSLVKVVLVLIFSLKATYSQSNLIEWQGTYGGSSAEGARSIIQTLDGGYISIGSTYSIDGDVTGNHGDYDVWIVKTDANGVLIWQKCLGGSDTDLGYSIIQNSDSSYVLLADSKSVDGDVSGNHGFGDFWVVKLDVNGSIIWQHSYGGNSYDRPQKIEKTIDGGFIAVGRTTSTDSINVTGYHGFGGYDAWVVKIDSLGAIQWQKCFGAPGDDRFQDVSSTNDGGFLAVGWTNSNSDDVSGNHGGNFDCWVVKIDSIGNIQWQRCFGGSGDDRAESIQNTNDGGFIFAGRTNSSNGDVTVTGSTIDYWVVKIDNSGNINWQKRVGGSLSDYAYSIRSTSDGRYIVAGNSNSMDGDVSGHHSLNDYWVLKLDSANIYWQISLGGSSDEYTYSALQASDGGYIVTGSTGSNDGDVIGNNGGSDFWMVKLKPCIDGTPAISVNGPTTFCSGNSLSLFSNNSIGSVWSTGDTTSLITVNSSGTYILSISNSQCGVLSDSVIVTVNQTPATPVITASGSTSLCSGATVTLTSSSASNNTWSNGSLLQSITVNQTGSYSVTVEQNGCYSTSSAVSVNVYPYPTVNITASGSLNLCQGDTVVLSSNNTIGNSWSTGDTTQSISVALSGVYSLTVSNGFCSRTASKTVNVYQVPLPPVVTTNRPTALCFGDTVVLTADTSGNVGYLRWSNGRTSTSISVSTAGSYYAIMTNSICRAISDTFVVTVTYPVATDICLVAVDSSSGFNQVIFEKPFSDVLDSFCVYKEGTISGVYTKVGAIPSGAFSVYVDSTSNPQQKADRYKICSKDTCGRESSLSLPHKTIHLSINQGVGNTYNLIWDNYEGFTYGTYYILRGTTPSNMIVIDSVQSSLNSYTDLNPPSGSLNYAVEVRKPIACNPTARNSSVAYVASRSNIKDNFILGESEIQKPIQFSISPNPSHESITIEFELSQQKVVQVSVYDLTGRVVHKLNNNILYAGQNKFNWNLSNDNGRVQNGVYILSITSDGITQMRRFVVM